MSDAVENRKKSILLAALGIMAYCSITMATGRPASGWAWSLSVFILFCFHCFLFVCLFVRLMRVFFKKRNINLKGMRLSTRPKALASLAL